jgi:hypothetical protein
VEEPIGPDSKSHSMKESYCASTVIGSKWSCSDSVVTFKKKKGLNQYSSSSSFSDFYESIPQKKFKKRKTKSKGPKMNHNVGVPIETPDLTRKTQKDINPPGFVEENKEESFPSIDILSDHRELPDRESQDDRVEETIGYDSKSHSIKESYCASTVIGSTWSCSDSVVTFKKKKGLNQYSDSSNSSDFYESIPQQKLKKLKKKRTQNEPECWSTNRNS